MKTLSPEGTILLGRLMGRFLFPGTLVLLQGELGAGKTTLIKGIGEGLGITKEEITSPSFIIVREYKGRLHMYHIDLYRLDRVDDLREEGLDEIVYNAHGVVLIEWPERIYDTLPENRFHVNMEWLGPLDRDIHIGAEGKEYEHILSKIRMEIGKMKTHGIEICDP